MLKAAGGGPPELLSGPAAGGGGSLLGVPSLASMVVPHGQPPAPPGLPLLGTAARAAHAAAPASPRAMQPEAAAELLQEVEAFLAKSKVDSRAVAHLRAQEPGVMRIVLERGDLLDCTNPSAALMGRIQVARDHLQSERSRATGVLAPAPSGPAPLASPLASAVPTTATGTAGGLLPGVPAQMSGALAAEIEQFVNENQLDAIAAKALSEADAPVAQNVLALGCFKNCRNPSAVCLARIREARMNPIAAAAAAASVAAAASAEAASKLSAAGASSAEASSMSAAARSELEEALNKFLKNNEAVVDSRAAAALRAQAPEIQRAVVERGELADCQNPSTALMGRIRAAHDQVAAERRRGEVPGLPPVASSAPVQASPEVEDFIASNDVDGLAARQLREAPKEIQEDVVARGSLSDCRNPSAVCLARIREAKTIAKETRQERELAMARSNGSGTAGVDAFQQQLNSMQQAQQQQMLLQQQQQMMSGMMMPMMMGNPMQSMMMMAGMQQMQQMQASMMMGNLMMGGMGMGSGTFPMGSMGNPMMGGTDQSGATAAIADAGSTFGPAATDNSAAGRAAPY